MSKAIELEMAEDKALRDAALALVKADIEHLKADMRAKGIGERALDRVSEGAVDVYEEARELAGSNKGIFATLIAALFVWFARHPLLEWLGLEDSDEEDQPGLFDRFTNDGADSDDDNGWFG